MTYNLDDICDIYAPTPQAWRGFDDWDRERHENFAQPTGHWIAYPRKWKRMQRKAKITWQNIHAHQPSEVWQRKARGYRKHIRRMKAKL